MEFKPLFVREYKDYKRDFNFIKQYLDQCETYAKLQNPNIDLVAYRKWMNQQLKQGGLFPIKDRKMMVIMKDEHNDRQKNVIPVSQYFRSIERQDLRFAPTMTTYQPEYRMKSLEALFLLEGTRKRSMAKKKKFEAKERGDAFMESYWDLMQASLKVLNNSSSGAKSLPMTILYNASGHQTLTSICRSETSFANSNNEKFLGGYRHYYNRGVVINNILAVLTYCDREKTQRTMEKYQLHYVTPEELSTMVKRSTDIYWRSPVMTKKIDDFIKTLSPLECSMYLYNTDFYMLRQFNSEFVRHWMNKLIRFEGIEPLPLEEAEQWIKMMDSDLSALVVTYLADLCDGESIRTAMERRPDIVPIVGAVVKNTMNVLDEYRELIETFWVTDIMPMETAHVPEMMRGVVIGSDTDSSLFSVDEWVGWYNGEVVHDSTSTNLEATLIYFSSMQVAHILRNMTTILGVDEAKRNIFSMKNEFMFSSFTSTSLGKHYFAKKEAQEGILIPKTVIETEIKGVNLKHTKVPKHITKGFHQELETVMHQIENDEKISVLQKIKQVAELEYSIYQSIRQGEPIYLQRGQVKVEGAYKNPNNPYKRGYRLWEDVFAPKYGHTMEPPYESIKISIGTDTKARFNKWLDAFEDKELAERMRNWVEEHNEGRPIRTFFIPQAISSVIGIPDEFMMAMEPRKMVYNIVSPYYILSECYGLYYRTKKVARLFSDEFPQYTIPERILDLGSSDDVATIDEE